MTRYPVSVNGVGLGADILERKKKSHKHRFRNVRVCPGDRNLSSLQDWNVKRKNWNSKLGQLLKSIEYFYWVSLKDKLHEDRI